MLDDPILGLPKLVAFMNHWIACSRGSRRRSRCGCPMSSSKLAATGGGRALPLHRAAVSADESAGAIAGLQLSSAAERERAASGANPWLAPGDPGNPDLFKFREGRSGSYKTFFKPEQIKWIERYMVENLLNANEFLSPGSKIQFADT